MNKTELFKLTEQIEQIVWQLRMRQNTISKEEYIDYTTKLDKLVNKLKSEIG